MPEDGGKVPSPDDNTIQTIKQRGFCCLIVAVPEYQEGT
jgi:hypothetical protein